jgi:endonuclease YncB( thermonuclease family)
VTLLLVSASARAERARVVDGNSLKLAGEDIRLIGIDAPEGSQICQRAGSAVQRITCRLRA